MTQGGQLYFTIYSGEFEKKKSSIPYWFAIAGICVLHLLLGYFQMPQKVLEVGLQPGSPEYTLRVGYALGIFCIYAIPIPFVVALLSLIKRSKRNLVSFSKVLFWMVLIMLFANAVMSFVLVPMYINSVKF